MKYTKIILPLSLLIFVFFPLFWELHEWPIQIFDEARNVLNSWEMSQNSNYIVTYINGEPDMWNTKPPLFFWMQSTSIKIFGFNTFAIRIPAAIFGFFTCIMMFWFATKYLKNKWIGYLSVMILVTFQGYIRSHVTRTGDFDSMLVFFTTAQILAFYLYLKTPKSKYIYSFFVFVTLACLTKGIAGLFFTPIFFAYLFIDKRFVQTITNKYTWMGVGTFIFFLVGYYVLREQYNPGYFKASFANDMGGRFTVPQEGNGGNIFYYCNARELLYWIYFFLPAFVLPFFLKEKKEKRFIFYLMILSIFYFVLLSSAQTKLPWYLAQVYPLLAIIISYFLYHFIVFVNARLKDSSNNLRYSIVAFLIIAIFTYPYIITMKKVVQGEDSERNNPRYAASYFLKDEVINGQLDLTNYIYLNEGYNPHIDYYVAKINHSGVKVSYGKKEKLKSGNKIFLWQDHVLEFIKKEYDYHEISGINKITLIEIK